MRESKNWTTREQALAWRIEDLNGRLRELSERLPSDRMDEKYDRRFSAKLTGEQLDHTIPAQLYTVEDVLHAIRRAEDRLWCLRCDRREMWDHEKREAVIPGQIVMIGFLDPAGILPEKIAS